MSENNDMQCPECGGELPGPPGKFNKCCHCGGRIYWYGRKVLKKPKLTERPVVIEPLSPNTYEPPEVPEKDPERIEQEKKRKAQWELDQLVQNALEEEEVAQRRALREEEKAKRQALWEEEQAKREARRKEEQAKRRALREEEGAKRQALWEEEQAKQGARLREEKIKQSRKASADIFSFFVLLLILCSIPAFLSLIPTALKQFVELISKFIDYLLLL